MTQDDIIDMAQEAGFVEYELDDGTTNAFDIRYQRFANLVAAAEREAIAQMFEASPELISFAQNDQGGCIICGLNPKIEAKAIRARGNT